MFICGACDARGGRAFATGDGMPEGRFRGCRQGSTVQRRPALLYLYGDEQRNETNLPCQSRRGRGYVYRGFLRSRADKRRIAGGLERHARIWAGSAASGSAFAFSDLVSMEHGGPEGADSTRPVALRVLLAIAFPEEGSTGQQATPGISRFVGCFFSGLCIRGFGCRRCSRCLAAFRDRWPCADVV